jgi:hypothetical protein
MGIFDKLSPAPTTPRRKPGTPDQPEPSLAELEAVVDAGLDSITHVGLALEAIKQRELFRPTYPDWPSYLDARWKLTPDYAQRLIQAAAIAAKIKAAGLPEPTRTSHTRELAKVKPDAVTQVWKESLDEANQDPEAITANLIADKATKHRKRKARRKAPKAIRLKGKGWSLVLTLKSVDVDPLRALDEATDQLEAKAKPKAA